jgi:hypothetical protein
MSRVEFHSQFEPPPQETLLQSEILFRLHSFSWQKSESRSALGLGSKVDVVHPSGGSRLEIVSLALRHLAWRCQHIPPIFVDLLRRKEHLSLEESDECNIHSSTFAPWSEH